MDVMRPATSDVRALTLHQPYGSLLLVDGADRKDVENRPRPVPSTLPQWYRCGCGHRISPDEEHPYGDPAAHAVVRPDPATGEPSRQACGPGEPDGPYPFRLGIHAGKTWHDGTYGGWLSRRSNADGRPQLWPPGTHDGIWGWQPQCHRMIDVPLGALIGFVTVTGCHHADECGWSEGDPRESRLYREGLCSRWAEPDQYHIVTADPVRLDEPIPMRGWQGWWRLPDRIDVPAVAA